MAQIRIFDYHAPRTTDLLNTRWDRAFPESVTEGMAVSKGTGDFDINIGIGTWFCDGVMLYESATLVDEVTLDAPGVLPRIDVIYGTFTYETDASPTAATYSILKGTAGSVPVEPSVITNQVKIAAIYIPSTAGDLDDCSIEQAYTLKEQLRMVLGVKVEGNLWIEAEVDPFLTTGHPTETLVRSTQIQDGDLWIETGGLDLFLYDADNNQWVTSAVLSHASTHSCASSDQLDVKDLCDTLSYLHRGTKTAHDALGLSHASLSSVTANQHHAQDHSSRHSCGADDSLDVKDVCDTAGYLHKHATALAECPHGNECHDVAYAECPHGDECHNPPFVTRRLYQGSNPISEVDLSTGLMVRQFTSPAVAYFTKDNDGHLWGPDVHHLTSGGLLYELDPGDSFAQVGVITLPSMDIKNSSDCAWAAADGSGGPYIWFSSSGYNLVKFDLATEAVVADIAIISSHGECEGVGIDDNGDLWVAWAHSSMSLSKIDPVTGGELEQLILYIGTSTVPGDTFNLWWDDKKECWSMAPGPGNAGSTIKALVEIDPVNGQITRGTKLQYSDGIAFIDTPIT